MKHDRSQLPFRLRFWKRLPFQGLAILAILVFLSTAHGNESKEDKHALVLFPNQSDLPACPLVEKGIKSSLAAGTEFRIEYLVEHMYLYRNADQTHNPSIKVSGRESLADKPLFRPNSKRFT